MSAVEALLGRIIDYAGLFPPAALDMEAAVRNYQTYLAGEHRWMLGNFLVPARRLGEFAKAFESVCCGEQEAPWTLSIVCGGEVDGDATAVAEFQQGAAFIGSLEAKAADARAAEAVLTRLPAARARYVEFPPEKAAEVLPVLADYGARAKIRMGGTGAEVPPVEVVARFLLQCAKERVAWKATAGLHAPLRAEVREADKTEMHHGFVNLFLAGALAFYGADERAVANTLHVRGPKEFRFDDDVVRWEAASASATQEQVLITEQIERVRSEFAISFGSCSFDEPVEGLKFLG
ncbi:MAG: hypothetical protein ACLGXA_21515, partial [Acidobacteriota bacterium]